MKNIIIKKIVVIFILIIIITEFIIPNYVYASVGDDLVGGIFSLLAFLGDTVMTVLQKIMVGGSGRLEIEDKFFIRYSPGMIFADQVAGLKVNFITAKEGDKIGTDFSWSPKSNNEMINLVCAMADAYNPNEGITGAWIGTFRLFKEGALYEGLLRPEQEGWAEERMIIENNHFGNSVDDVFKVAGITRDYGSNTLYVKYDSKRVIIKGNGVTNNWKLLDGTDISDGAMSPVIPNSASDDYYVVWVTNGYLWVLYVDGYYNDDDEGYGWGYFDVADGGSLVAWDLDFIGASYDTKDSIAYELQPEIARWYTGLRMVTIVGLLSILLYIGIQIVLKSTSAQDKAKYKNMLKDWVIALCILFLLHYIMAFMTTFTKSVTGIIYTTVIDEDSNHNSYDRLISTLRNNLDESIDSDPLPKATAGYIIIYLALVILTVVFTIQYIKRVIFLAFLTMIAPMIAFTYPLDKIKDGKAQAFSYWLREYIFNCLIQPVHLLLYAVFVYSSMDFAIDHPLYAIVTMAFMVPAEKIIKEMFGMKSQSPTNNLAAAAGGAMAMNMVNKLRGVGPKGGSGKNRTSGERTGIRTASRSSSRIRSSLVSSSSAPFSSETSSPTSSGSEPLGPAPTGPEPTDPAPTGPALTDSAPLFSAPAGMGGYDVTNSDYRSAGEMAKGIAGLGGEAAGYLATKGLGVLGAGLAVTGSVAAQVASGGLFENTDKAITAVGIGTTSGYLGGQGLAKGLGQIPGNIKNAKDTVDKVIMTTEAYNNKKFDEKFYKSEGYKMMSQDRDLVKMYGNEKGLKLATQQFLDNGITDATQIKKALQAGISGDVYKKFTKNGVSDVKDITKLQDAGVDVETYDKFVQMGIKDSSRIIKGMKYLSKDKSGKLRSIETIAGLLKIAQYAGAKKDKEELLEFVTSMKIKDKTVTPEEAEDIYINLINLL